VLKSVRAAVQAAIMDPANAFTKRLIPNTWYELHELLQIQTEEQGLKHTTRRQVAEWAAECGMGAQPGISLETETDGFLQLMHAYGLVVWHSEPGLRGVVVLDSQWLVDAISIVIRDLDLHRLALDDPVQKAMKKEWVRYHNTGYLASSLLHAFWTTGSRAFDAVEHGFLTHMLLKFNLIVPMRPPPGAISSAVEMYIVPTMLKEPGVPVSMSPPPAPAGALVC
jgi:hypothetical protein